MTQIQVGKLKEPTIPGTSPKKYKYPDLKYNEDGWAKAARYLPEEYDLVLLKYKNRTVPGWRSGNYWDGRMVDANEEVIYWKRQKDCI